MKIALLIIDMQHLFVKDAPVYPDLSRACEYINYTARLLRDSGHLVVHVQDMEEATSAAPEKLGIIEEITQADGDRYIEKMWSNAFWNTELEELLAEQAVGLVVVAGYAAEHCVTFTFNGARERGFKAAILQNGILGEKPDSVPIVARDRSLVSYTVLDYLAQLSRLE
ncbi:cysteine hydrolase family protein [Paenibacillus methanolicus]|uniref:Nicotinamidase-related amidase n=1 Tax=Paenibacillus methanolicus TaxID=582686 RepID=A0A5S5C581_9BACL|nr:isochorismatase family protein [Paenibacillus methanolicus]TYP73768.1 nicotinamidase-related amidase [Paenibacillus methanolicus]